MEKKNLLDVVNSCPQYAAEALENVYRGKVLVVGRSYNTHLDGFFKTNRGAEGYIKKHSTSYYDEYSREMVNSGAGMIVEEVNASEILDPQTSKEIWFAWMLECLGQSYLYDMILNTAKRLNVSDEVMEYVQASVQQMKEENCLSALKEEIVEVEEVEVVEESPVVKEDWQMTLEEFIEAQDKIGDRPLSIFHKTGLQQLHIEEVHKAYQEKRYEEAILQGQITKENVTKVLASVGIHQEIDTDTKTVETASSISYRLNEQMNGIEIIFAEKPEQSVIENLKNNGFRWSRHNSLWYARQTPERIKFAKSLCGKSKDNESVKTSPVHTSYPEIDIEDIHTYVVDTKLQEAENDSNWIFRKNKIDRTKEIQEHFTSYNKQVKEVLMGTDSERIAYYLKLALQRYKKKYFENYLTQLRHKGNNPSWAVTGRGNLNKRKYNKAMSLYEKLVGESVELTNQMKQAIEKAKRDIRQDKENKVRSTMAQTNVELLFQVEQKQITFNGLTKNLRTYNYGEYAIAKTWGCYRIFKDGKQIYSMKSNDKLDDAKKYVALLVNGKISA